MFRNVDVRMALRYIALLLGQMISGGLRNGAFLGAVFVSRSDRRRCFGGDGMYIATADGIQGGRTIAGSAFTRLGDSGGQGRRLYSGYWGRCMR